VIATVTLFSATRIAHVLRQQSQLRDRPEVGLRILVWLDADAPPHIDGLDGATILHLPPGADGLRLAAGRNAGADAALDTGADLLVFLDADCIPGPDLIGLYSAAAAIHSPALLCGPVTYLPEGSVPSDETDLRAATAPHPARPAPPSGTTLVAGSDEYPLFWSLSFAVTATTWRDLGGFDDRFEGYGGEDTDYAFTARERGVPLVWVGGAHAYHQHHPTSSPPWQHLDDILRNGRLFADRWEVWPMEGWISRFAAAGAIERHGDGWVRVREVV
jgi:N-acetylglucosaminyl-diphospho-decaprenol L-rhamnosyltransferase